MSESVPKVGPYNISGQLGRGGMGVVYRAEHEESGLPVALKTVRVPNQELIHGIRREIQGIASLNHPGIVKIVDSGLHEGLPWYAMELLKGVTLRKFFQDLVFRSEEKNTPGSPATAGIFSQQTIPLADSVSGSWWTNSLWSHEVPVLAKETTEVFSPFPELGKKEWSIDPKKLGDLSHQYQTAVFIIMRRLCSPLAYMHGQGVVHKDLKPDNIVITPDCMPVIIDFGLMTQFGGEISRESLFVDAGSAGTVLYMSPEQIQGKLVDARTDLYAVGCILYELLTGKPPFREETVSRTFHAHLCVSPLAPSEIRPELPPEIDELILKLLTKDPSDRLGYADDLARRLVPLCPPDETTTPPAQKPHSYLYRPGFSGREAEISALVSHLDELAAGQGRIVILNGESGVGKTRLVIEFARTITMRMMHVFTGECLVQGSQPLQAFRKLLQYVADRCRERGLKETEKLLGPRGKVLSLYEPSLLDLPGLDRYPEPSDLTPEASQQRLYRYLLQTLDLISQGKPIILIIDDVQWADDLTFGFLHFLLTEKCLTHRPFLIVCPFRPEEMSENMHLLLASPLIVQINIPRLDEQAVCDMVSTMLAVSSPPVAFCSYLTLHSEGNPFFVAEYLRAAVQQELLWRDESGQWQIVEPSADYETNADFHKITLPTVLKDLISRRLTGLSEITESVLKIIAISGREAQFDLVKRTGAYSDSDINHAILELSKRHILEEVSPGRVRFVHDKIRTVAYSSIADQEKQKLHTTLAASIEALYTADLSPFYAALAYHYEQGTHCPKAAHWHEKAARKAMRQYAYHDAKKHLTRALELLPASDHQKQYDILAERVNLLNLQGARAEQHCDLEELRKLAEILADDVKAEVASLYSTYYSGIGKFEQAKTEAEQVIKFSRALHNEILESKGYLQLGSAFLRQGEYQQALNNFQHSLSLTEKHNVLQLWGDSLNNLGIVYWATGKLDAAINYLKQARALYRREEVRDRQGEGAVLHNLGMISTDKWEFGQAQSYYEQGLFIFRQIGDRHYENNALIALGNIHTRLGMYEDARMSLELALEISREIQDPRGESLALINLAYVSLQLDHLERAEQYCRQAILIMQKTETYYISGNAFTVLGHVSARKHDWQKALEAYQKAYDGYCQSGMNNQALEPLAGKALIHHEQGELVTAFSITEEILHHLTHKSLVGTINPLAVYFSCYQILCQVGDDRAYPVLEKAYKLMTEVAEKLSDERRHVYLHRISVHQQILIQWHQLHQEDDESAQ
ncbi:tetratricopeptide repeat protein [candidate division CSSED10-310 bacterium]|uniref:Tetratricopeptide repeat protein n=1 Tax=candidate division CSSED10-310 bacterium TaxID=2855610 RepID=A0ABV6YYB4_UNCC1